MGLARVEINIPDVGLFYSDTYPVPYVKRRIIINEQLLKPMKFVTTFNPADGGLKRFVTQSLSKPMQLTISKTRGFIYQLTPRSDAVISKLVVNLDDLDEAISYLIAEANRFYLLYCYPII